MVSVILSVLRWMNVWRPMDFEVAAARYAETLAQICR